jgi:hypothetical protein
LSCRVFEKLGTQLSARRRRRPNCHRYRRLTEAEEEWDGYEVERRKEEGEGIYYDRWWCFGSIRKIIDTYI